MVRRLKGQRTEGKIGRDQNRQKHPWKTPYRSVEKDFARLVPRKHQLARNVSGGLLWGKPPALGFCWVTS